MILSDAGQIVHDCWKSIRTIDPDVWLDEFIVMPDHFHAIVGLSGRTPVGAHPCAPLLARPARSLGALIAQFKATTTRLINPAIDGVRPRLWQRIYYDVIIRDQAALARIRRYIITNPVRW
jgi:REP element-mobilizing transposase RayT